MFKRKPFLNSTCGHEYKSMNTKEAGFCKYTITDTTYEMYVRSLWIWLTNSGPYFYLYKFWEHVITLNLEFIYTGHNKNIWQDVIYMSNVQFSGNLLRWGFWSYGK
jgi:hypothetical protein